MTKDSLFKVICIYSHVQICTVLYDATFQHIYIYTTVRIKVIYLYTYVYISYSTFLHSHHTYTKGVDNLIEVCFLGISRMTDPSQSWRITSHGGGPDT